MSKDIRAEILAENERRLKALQADYDPVTGRGLDGRTLLKIPDYAIPEQWVPKEMMKDSFIKAVVKAGSIDKLCEMWKGETLPDRQDIERHLRKLRQHYDFIYWAYFCFPIKAKEGGRVHFKLNYPQLIVDREVEALRLKGEPMNIIICKARQWGGSTYSIAKQTWIMLEWDQFHSFSVAAHVQSAAETIVAMLKNAIRDYPAWSLGLPADESLHLAPAGRSGSSYVIKDSHDNQVVEALIHVGTAEKPDSLRSKDISGAHYSEVGVWPDTPEKRPEDLIADISGGIAHRPLTMQVMESTAKTSDDFFHDMYLSAKRGESTYRAVFIPWFYIPHDTLEIKDMDGFLDWLLSERDNPARSGKWKSPGKHYWWLWQLGASLEGINWYRYKELGFSTYAQMANEAPSTDIEAFQAAGTKVFDIYDVEAMMKECREPLYEGDLVSAAAEGPDVIKDIRFIQKRGGNLKVWEMPDDSPVADRYVVAVDIGGPNPTSDFSSVRVLDRLLLMPDMGGLNGRPNIVAEMHYHTDHDLLAYDAVRLAAWYNNALLVIESNTVEMENRERNTGGGGSEYILDIVSDIYPNQYFRHGKEEDIVPGAPRKWGFETTRFTKPKIIDNMRACLRDRRWVEPSMLCCEEMSMYIQDGNKFTAPPKKHDDVLMATAILLWVGLNEMPVPHWVEVRKIPSRETTRGNNYGKI